MRVHVLPIVGLGISAVAMATAFAPLASAVDSRTPTFSAGSQSAQTTQFHPDSNRTCYSQLDNDNGISIVSQNFETAFNAYDSRAADDFTMTRDCVIRRVDVAGVYLNGSGPASSENVTIYRSRNGLPAGVVSNQVNQVGVDDGTGNLQVALGTLVALPAHQTYIVSVQVNMNFSTGGEWAWSTNNTQRGFQASWRNNEDGFGTGCEHFAQLLTCIPSNEGPDLAFSLENNR